MIWKSLTTPVKVTLRQDVVARRPEDRRQRLIGGHREVVENQLLVDSDVRDRLYGGLAGSDVLIEIEGLQAQYFDRRRVPGA